MQYFGILVATLFLSAVPLLGGLGLGWDEPHIYLRQGIFQWCQHPDPMTRNYVWNINHETPATH